MKRRDFLSSCFGTFAGMEAILNKGKLSVWPDNLKKAKQETDVLVLVLGTAQDGGFPHAGCYCESCVKARKDKQFARLITSLAILDLKEKKFFLLDATPDIRIQLDMAFKRLSADKQPARKSPHGVILTHAHIGHYTGLMFFGHEALSTYKLPVYCTSQMKGFLAKNGPWSQLVSLENISFRLLSPGKEFSLTSQISLFPLLVPHRDEYSDTLGFIIGIWLINANNKFSDTSDFR